MTSKLEDKLVRMLSDALDDGLNLRRVLYRVLDEWGMLTWEAEELPPNIFEVISRDQINHLQGLGYVVCSIHEFETANICETFDVSDAYQTLGEASDILTKDQFDKLRRTGWSIVETNRLSNLEDISQRYQRECVAKSKDLVSEIPDPNDPDGPYAELIQAACAYKLLAYEHRMLGRMVCGVTTKYE